MAAVYYSGVMEDVNDMAEVVAQLFGPKIHFSAKLQRACAGVFEFVLQILDITCS